MYKLDIKNIPYDVLCTLINEQEAYVIDKYYKESKTLAEIGKELGVSGSRIGQIKERAIKKLVHPSRHKLIQQYLKGSI